MVVAGVDPDSRPDLTDVRELSARIDPDLGAYPLFEGLRAYWASLKDGRALPLRREIDPVELRDHLGSLFIAQMRKDRSDFTYRLIGTRLLEVFDRDFTGMTVSQTFAARPRVGLSVIAAYKKCLNTRAPMLTHGTVIWAAKTHVRFEALHVPFSSDGEKADVILGSIAFHDRRRGPPHPRSA